MELERISTLTKAEKNPLRLSVYFLSVRLERGGSLCAPEPDKSHKTDLKPDAAVTDLSMLCTFGDSVNPPPLELVENVSTEPGN